jgi:membrane protease subunit (stomatin/prohibitin family)
VTLQPLFKLKKSFGTDKKTKQYTVNLKFITGVPWVSDTSAQVSNRDEFIEGHVDSYFKEVLGVGRQILSISRQ